MTWRMTVPLLVAAMLASGAAAAQNSAEPAAVAALRQCQQVADSTARLACFDKAAAGLVGAVSQGEIAVIDREAVRDARRSLFGFALPKIPFLKGGKGDKDGEEPKELVTKLASFGSAGSGKYRITVENGDAVWETTESASIYDPSPGDKVVIQRGALGAYFIQIANQRWVRARRVR